MEYTVLNNSKKDVHIIFIITLTVACIKCIFKPIQTNKKNLYIISKHNFVVIFETSIIKAIMLSDSVSVVIT